MAGIFIQNNAKKEETQVVGERDHMRKYADVHKYAVLGLQFPCFPRTTLQIKKKESLEGYLSLKISWTSVYCT